MTTIQKLQKLPFKSNCQPGSNVHRVFLVSPLSFIQLIFFGCGVSFVFCPPLHLTFEHFLAQVSLQFPACNQKLLKKRCYLQVDWRSSGAS